MTVEMHLFDHFDTELSSQKGYKRSYEVCDGHSKNVLANCELYGYVQASEIKITEADGEEFTLRPNRKVMPSKWILSDHLSQAVYEISRASVAELMNPLGRKLLTIHCLNENKKYVLLNLAKSKLDLVFGPSSLEWYLMEGDVPKAGIERRQKKLEGNAAKGFMGKLKSFFQPAYWILVTNAETHLISAPAFLAMMMLFETFTKNVE